MENVVILGAATPLATALANELAAHGFGLVLADPDELSAARIATELSARYSVPARAVPFDAHDFADPGDWLIRCLPQGAQRLEGLVLFPVPDSEHATGLAVLTRAAEYLHAQQGGFLCAGTEYLDKLPAAHKAPPVHLTYLHIDGRHAHRASADPAPVASSICRALLHRSRFVSVVDTGRAMLTSVRQFPLRSLLPGGRGTGVS